MGTSLFLNLIAGVPLLDLGELRVEKTSISETNRLGEKTGKVIIVKDIYLDTPKESFFIGSNKNNIANPTSWGNARIEYSFESLFPDLQEYEEYWDWIFGDVSIRGATDPKDALQGIWVGQPITTTSSLDWDWIKHEVTTIKDIINDANTVMKELEKRFGYGGRIFIVAQAENS